MNSKSKDEIDLLREEVQLLRRAVESFKINLGDMAQCIADLAEALHHERGKNARAELEIARLRTLVPPDAEEKERERITPPRGRKRPV